MPVQSLGTTIFDSTVSGAPGSTYQGRRHAAEALYGEAAKRPSNSYTHTLKIRPSYKYENQ